MKRSEIKKRPLTDATLQSLEPEAKEYKEKDGDGLYLRVRPSGHKSWYIRYKDPITGKWKPYKHIGDYPAMGGMLARKTAKDLLERIAKGESLIEQEQSYALVDLINEWLAQKKMTTKTYKMIKGRMDNYVIPVFGNRDYRTIKPQEWLAHFRERQATTGHHDVVRRVSNHCTELYNYAKFKRNIDHNPLDGISPYLAKHIGKSYPHVEQHEVGQLMRDIQRYPTEQGIYALTLLAIFYCRPSELITAKWTDFDFDKMVWLVPSENTKTEKDVIRPIPTQAKAILDKLKIIHGHSEYLFPNSRDKERPATIEFLEHALHRLGYKGRHSPHGFRHIASTRLNEHTEAGELKFDERVIEFSLSHTISGIKGKYNKAKYLDDRRKLAQWYADELYRLMACD